MTRALIAAVVLVALLASRGAGAEAAHPLDALDAEEIATAVALLREAGHADADTLFAEIAPREPPKSAVLAFTPGQTFPRAAELVFRRAGTTRIAVVDLRTRAIDAVRDVPGAQPLIPGAEVVAASAATAGDSRMRAGLALRGIDDPSTQVFCAPRTVGNFGEPDEQTRRLVKVDCFDIRGVETNVFATPIEGLFATVDLDAREVLAVTDLGVVPLPPGRGELDPDSIGPQRAARPVIQAAPRGGNIELRGSLVRWQKWSFHVRWDLRSGVIVSLVGIDEGDGPRSVLYQGSLAEIFVPYQDPTPGWYFRNYMDQGDYGLGPSGSRLVRGSDCPADALYLSPVMANAAGGADTLQDRICIFERALGEPVWRHADLVTGHLESRPALELVVRSIATVGNYDYVFDWLFDQGGELAFRGAATGIDAVKGVASRSLADETAEADTAWGPLIAPGRAGILHDHFFSIRLDVDVDGTRNTFVRDRLVAEAQPPESPRRSLWRLRSEPTRNERDGRYRLSFEQPALWRVVSPQRTNALGYPTGYALRAHGNALPLVDPADPPLARAGFASYHLWVTPYDPEQRYAAGRFPNQSTPGQGLPAWTSAGRGVQDTDIVLWYTLGFHHVPSTEDWPVYNLGWHQVTLRPYNFFDRNPGLDVPPVATPR